MDTELRLAEAGECSVDGVVPKKGCIIDFANVVIKVSGKPKSTLLQKYKKLMLDIVVSYFQFGFDCVMEVTVF